MKKCCLLFLSLWWSYVFSQQRDSKKGEDLFKTHCSACHKLDEKILGPPLKDIEKKRENKWLHSWIKDNEKLRKSGDKLAIEIYKEYNQMIMQSFPSLSNDDIENILEYTSNPPFKEEKKEVSIKENGERKLSEEEKEVLLNYAILGTIIIVLLVSLLLIKLKILLNLSLDRKELSIKEELISFKYFLLKKNIVSVILPVIIIGGLYLIWTFMLNIGVDKGYKPIQPIAFSHKIHAGDNEIDCKYCHSSVTKSKTAGIPSTNVCMNCHRLIQKGTNTGNTEISKIYESIGYDSERADYKKDFEQKPIEWVKVHNLQDFVFFSHKQHVSVGKLDCKECHGPIEKMDEVYQYSDLTMRWCIDCHRKKEIQMEGNPYYEKIHAQLKKKYGVDKFTVDMIGGLECGKCHY